MRTKRTAPPVGELFRRDASIATRDVDAKARTVNVSFSSQTDAVRFLGIPQVLLHERGSVDLEGLSSVLLNHDPDQIIGRAEGARIDPKERKGRARIVFDDDPESARAFAKVEAGSLRGVSVGFRVDRWQILDEGDTWTSPEGQKFEGPADIATAWRGVEFSLTPIPADHTVGVGRNSSGPSGPRSSIMQQVDTEPAAVRDDQGEPDLVDVRAERKRVKEIRDLCGLYPQTRDLEAELVDSGASIEQTRIAILDRMKETRPPLGGGQVRVDFGRDERDKFRENAELALALRAGAIRGDEAKRARERVSFLGPQTLVGLATECVRRARLPMSVNAGEILTRAISHSTSDFPSILSNVANKSLLEAYREAPATWRLLAKTASLPDFKLSNRLRLGDAGNLLLTRELEPMPEGTFAENVESYQLATYSKRFGISRQAIINDDLSAFDRIPRQMGAAAARVPQELLFDLLVSAAGVGPNMAEDALALFSATHTSGSNYTAAVGAIAVATLGTAKGLMRMQTGLAGPGEIPPILNITPQFLLVPSALEALALQFTTVITPNISTSVVPGWIPALQVIVEPRLDAATNGLTAWYLVSREVDGAEVGFLNGREEPELVKVEGTNVLGVEWGVYLDCAAHFVDHRGWYRCRGA